MNEKKNTEIKMCPLDQQEPLEYTAENRHMITGISFMGLILVFNLFLLF